MANVDVIEAYGGKLFQTVALVVASRLHGTTITDVMDDERSRSWDGEFEQKKQTHLVTFDALVANIVACDFGVIDKTETLIIRSLLETKST